MTDAMTSRAPLTSARQVDVMRETHSPAAGAAAAFDERTRDMRFGLGFRLSQAHLPQSEYWFSPNPRAFGHTGAGGASVGFADPEAQMSFGYAASLFGMSPETMDRRKILIIAAYAAVTEAERRIG